MKSGVPERLRVFAEFAPSGSLRALTALAAAESLSDELAVRLVERACPNEFPGAGFVSCLHLSGFVVERNSEWHISANERAFLNSELVNDRSLFLECHQLLADITDIKSASDISEVPRYLLTLAGRAYHHTAVSPTEGLQLYQATEHSPLSQQWLAAKLAGEQQELGILPLHAIEPAFLRGIVLYKEGNKRRALEVLRPVAYSDEVRQEVATAAHLVGRGIFRNEPSEGEHLLRRSIEIGEAINNRHHQAQVLHTLGQNLLRKNPREAESLLRRSLEILEGIGDTHGEAQVLHTLGQNLWRKNPREAEGLLRRSHEILERIDDTHGEAQVLHTLGQNLWRKNPREAESLLRRSIEIGEAINNRHHQAQVLHTLGTKLIELDPEQGERLLRESLKLGEELGNLRHQAIVLLSLGKLLWPTEQELGRTLILRSLALNRKSKDHEGQRFVLREMEKRGIEDPAN